MKFQTFLNGIQSNDYIFQKTPYEEQVRAAAEMISAAGYILLGGVDLDVTPLYKTLRSLFEGKKLFCLTTNVDRQFEKAGLPPEKIFATQGDYFHIQCAKGCHDKVYEASGLFRQMSGARTDCRIPSDMVPKCPVCGGRMSMNLRSDQYFVEDENWHQAKERFGTFLEEMLHAVKEGERALLFETGVGFNTPTIIRFPFEKLMREDRELRMVRLNLKEAVVPESFGDRAVGINADMAESIQDICAELKERRK